MEFEVELTTSLPYHGCGYESCQHRIPSAVPPSPSHDGFTVSDSDLSDYPISNTSETPLEVAGGKLPDISFPTYMKAIYTAWGVFLLFVGVVGNILVPVVVMRDRELRGATTSVFIVNLVVADLLVLIICLPSLILELYAPPAVWILPGSMC
ncbi:hypothetical protein SK128_002917, partial [Halocaridina rubra]